MGRNHRLHQQVSQYRQQAEVLTQKLGLMLWRTEKGGSVDGLDLNSDSALGDLADVIEVVQLDLQELLAEQDRRQHEMERTAQELTQLIDTANAPIFGVDTDGLINEWNQQVAQTSGYSKQEVLGQNLVEDYITQDYKQSVQQVLDQALLGSETDNYQVPLTTKDGRQVVILLNATTRRDTQGQVIGVVGVGQDITELNQYRQELEGLVDQRTAELQQALDQQIELTNQLGRQADELALHDAILKAEYQQMDGIFVTDLQMRGLEWNQGFLQLLNLHEPGQIEPLKQMTYRHWVQNAKRSFENYPSALNIVKQAYRQPQVSLQDELKTRQGATLLRHTMPLRDRQGEISGRIWVYRDVTDLVQARQAAVKAQQMAEQAQAEAEGANQAKSQFLSCMSHEIRTPMNDILGYLSLMDLLTPLMDSLRPVGIRDSRSKLWVGKYGH